MTRQAYNFVPYNLEFDELNQVLCSTSGMSKLTFKVLNFYTVIVKKMINNMFILEEEGSQFVFLNHHERRSLLGDSYIEIIDILKSNGYLVENDDWHYNEAGKDTYPKSYALPGWMFSDRIYKLFPVGEMKSIKNMIKRFNSLRFKKGSDEFREAMISSSERILIHDTPESRKAIQMHIDEVNDRNVKYQLRIEPLDLINLFNHCAFNQSIVDVFGKRVHTKVTNLPKEFRKFLYFDNRPGETLEGIDIVNSQPVFMSVATSEIIKRFTPELKESLAITEKYQNSYDLMRFRELCADGRIYETIQEYFLNNGKSINRNQAKIICFTVFFSNYNFFEIGSVKDELKNLAYNFLKKEFPDLYNMYKEMKGNRWKENEGKSYANNCMLAQRLESQIFYTVIVPAIWKAGYRDFTTIHDSIICPKSDKEGIQKIFVEEMERLNIKLKVA